MAALFACSMGRLPDRLGDCRRTEKRLPARARGVRSRLDWSHYRKHGRHPLRQVGLEQLIC